MGGEPGFSRVVTRAKTLPCVTQFFADEALFTPADDTSCTERGPPGTVSLALETFARLLGS